LASNAINVNFGTNTADAGKMCLTLGGSGGGQPNTVTGIGANGATDIRVRARFDTHVGLLDTPNYAGAAQDTTAVNTYLSGKNGGASASSTFGNAGNGFFGTCPP